MAAQHPNFKRARVAQWTREKIEALTTPELRQLHANAVRLKETEIEAMCGEVLDARPRGRLVERKPARKHAAKGLVSRFAALGLCGVVPRNRFWSRSGVRESDGGVVLTLWADDVKRVNGPSECLLWAPNVDGKRKWSDSPGGKERLAHCRTAVERGAAEGLLVYGVRIEGTLPEEKVLHMDGVDAENVLNIRVEQRGEEYWATWDGRMPGGAARPLEAPATEALPA